ncbi:MAG: amidohydrolase, partial [Lentisphaeria bacterium]|nr:amidohydrolase [Lentisphaeria bacterium]
WRNPEPGYKEFKTSKLATAKLKSLGLDVKENLAITGMRADLVSSRPGPALALLGEMDSLIIPGHPECDKCTGAVHSCGHNSHITAMVGAAMALVDAHAIDDLSGKIAFIGTPAEECIEIEWRNQLIAEGKVGALGGKPALIREGVFDDVDLAIMNHIGGHDHYGSRDHNGFVCKSVTFHGRSCHAAAPGSGVNAVHAATLAINALGLLNATFPDEARVHGIVTSGGSVVNVIPDTAKLEYMLRAPTMEGVEKLSDAFDRAMRGAALALGAEVEIQTTAGYMPLYNDAKLSDLLIKVVKENIPGNSGDFRPLGSFAKSSTDMGDVSIIMPAVHGDIPGGGGRSHGTTYFIADKKKAYLDNAKILALMAVELLYGDAALGREVAARRDGKISIAEYLRRTDALTKTEKFSEK